MPSAPENAITSPDDISATSSARDANIEDNDGFVLPKSRKAKLSLKIRAAKAAEAEKQKAALMASGTAKKLDGVPAALRILANNKNAHQTAAMERQLLNKKKHLAYLEQKARNGEQKQEGLAKQKAVREQKGCRAQKKAEKEAEEAAWVAKHEQPSLMDFVKVKKPKRK